MQFFFSRLFLNPPIHPLSQSANSSSFPIRKSSGLHPLGSQLLALSLLVERGTKLLLFFEITKITCML